MAAYRCNYSAVLLIICSISVFVVADTEDATLINGQDATALNSHETASKTAAQTAEQPAVEERQWEATPSAAAADDQDRTSDTPTAGAEAQPVVPPVLPEPKDSFQEELVFRPLHSGDIYASFQFRTLWETDFMRGNKGTLIHSREEISFRNSLHPLTFLTVVQCTLTLISVCHTKSNIAVIICILTPKNINEVFQVA